MTVGEILLALFIGIVVAVLLVVVGGYRGRPGQTAGIAIFFFFVIAFFFVMAAGVWTQPYGPTVADVYWVPFVFWGLVIALILAAVSATNRAADPRAPGTPPSMRERQDLEQVNDVTVAAGAFSVAFFILIVALIIGLIAAALD